MTGDTGIVAFAKARLDEDEAVAKRAAACALVQREGYEAGDWSWLQSYGQPQPEQVALIDHQARFDPARVLRDVEAGRRLLDAYLRTEQAVPAESWESDYTQALGQAVRFRAAVWRDHPEYDQSWAP